MMLQPKRSTAGVPRPGLGNVTIQQDLRRAGGLDRVVARRAVLVARSYPHCTAKPKFGEARLRLAAITNRGGRLYGAVQALISTVLVREAQHS
jgi:hypothetical protein